MTPSSIANREGPAAMQRPHPTRPAQCRHAPMGERLAAALACARALALAVVIVFAAAPPALAQMPTGQGPRFPYMGPSAAPPDGEGAVRPGSALPPGRSQACRWDLAGGWEGRGRQTDPAPNTYTTRLAVRQYGNFVVAEQASDGIVYYGVCSGDRIEFDAYSGDTYVGVQTGTISGNGRRIESTWVLYRPDYAAGYEMLTPSGRASR